MSLEPVLVEGLGDAALDSLWEASGTMSPFLSRDWFELLARHVVSTGGLRVFAVGGSGKGGASVRCALPMHVVPSRALGRPVRSVSSLANFYSPIFGVLAAGSDCESERERCLALSRCIQQDPGQWDLLNLAPLACGESLDILQSALDANGFRTQRYFCFGNWYLPCAGATYREYLAGRPGRLRSLIRRKSRALEREGAVRYEVAVEPEAVARAIPGYEAVYHASWKPDERYPAFVPELARLGASRGWTRLGLLSIDERPVAAQLWLVAHEVAYIFKLAYVPDAAAYSPGTLLTARLMEHVLERDRVREIDYLTGDDDYKRMWMSERRERFGLLGFRRDSLAGLALALRHIGGRMVKRVMPRTAGSRAKGLQ